MKLNPKQLAASAALLGVLACAAALPASAAGPVTTPLALTLPKVSFPWDKVTAESIETGSYDAAPLAGTAQQLSPVTPPSWAPTVARASTASSSAPWPKRSSRTRPCLC